jgi:hypothetical protein
MRRSGFFVEPGFWIAAIKSEQYSLGEIRTHKTNKIIGVKIGRFWGPLSIRKLSFLLQTSSIETG